MFNELTLGVASGLGRPVDEITDVCRHADVKLHGRLRSAANGWRGPDCGWHDALRLTYYRVNSFVGCWPGPTAGRGAVVAGHRSSTFLAMDM